MTMGLITTVGGAHDDALPGTGIQPIRVAVAARFFSLDESTIRVLQDLLAAAAACPDQVLQTEGGVLGINGLAPGGRAASAPAE